MKIGLSLSRCVRDIVEGRVDINDVLVIIARTKFDATNFEDWASIWEGYTNKTGWGTPEWQGLDGAVTHEMVLKLWQQGKIHQPRQFGAYAVRTSKVWLETVLLSEELEQNLAAQEAWKQFQTVAGLTNINIDMDYRPS